MGAFDEWMVGAGLAAFEATGLHRAFAPMTAGRGAILAFHNVSVAPARGFAPNRGLAITPEFLDAVLQRLRQIGVRIVPLEDIPLHLRNDRADARVVALTFDDGYRDTLDTAMPVLESHAAPFTVFATTGYLDRTVRLWWVELERALSRAEHVSVTIGGRTFSAPARTPAEKAWAFSALAAALRLTSYPEVVAALDALGCDPEAGRRLVEDLCLDWEGLARLADRPLATIGCHTQTHPCLAALEAGAMRAEMAEARDALAERLGRPVRHLAYPYGTATAAGVREFTTAADLGFATAVTTRPGVLYSGDRSRLTALPRVSINGLWQNVAVLDILLSGAPFWLRKALRVGR